MVSPCEKAWRNKCAPAFSTTSKVPSSFECRFALIASNSVCPMPTRGMLVACDNPFAVAIPARMPLKDPGPVFTAMRSMLSKVMFSLAKSFSMLGARLSTCPLPVMSKWHCRCSPPERNTTREKWLRGAVSSANIALRDILRVFRN